MTNDSWGKLPKITDYMHECESCNDIVADLRAKLKIAGEALDHAYKRLHFIEEHSCKGDRCGYENRTSYRVIEGALRQIRGESEEKDG